MRYRLRCPACGKSIYADAADAGRSIMCGACGARTDFPVSLEGLPQVPEAAAQAAAEDDLEVIADAEVSADPAKQQTGKPIVARSSRPWFLPLAAGATGAACVTAGLLIGL